MTVCEYLQLMLTMGIISYTYEIGWSKNESLLLITCGV